VIAGAGVRDRVDVREPGERGPPATAVRQFGEPCDVAEVGHGGGQAEGEIPSAEREQMIESERRGDGGHAAP
jgi:hypothetical protein